MTTRPPLTDTTALALHRARATPEGDFLHAAVADELDHRLKLVNRAFKDIAIITGNGDYWEGVYPQATQVPSDPHLQLAPHSIDLALHCLALHWTDDPVGQLVQMRHALRPDGLMLAASFGGETLAELRACLAQAETEVTGGLSPRVVPMGELRDMGGLLQRAGFALPVADAQKITVSYRDMHQLMHDLRAMGETNALAARLRKPTARRVFEHASRLYQQHFATADGRINATFEIIYLTGWAPADHQPKPLRPGSASARLADALGTTETPLND